jgi:capsid protein
MLDRVLDYFFPKKREINSEHVQASGFYDLEREDASVEEHFYYANNGSADYHANHSVREMIRKKVRYEYANSTILKGICQTRANTLVGKGPKLTLIPEADRSGTKTRKRVSEICKSISKKFNRWLDETDFAPKLRQMVKAKLVDGESFLAFVVTDRNSIGITPRVFDSERVTNGYSGQTGAGDEQWVDGIKYDAETGEPIKYRFLRQHPGGDYTRNNLQQIIPLEKQFNNYDETQVFHWFRKDRGEQHRGVSELLSSLQLSAILRRVQKSVAVSMETAANMSLGLYSELDASDGAGERPEDWEQIPVTPNMMTVFPHGVKPFQMDAKHPNAEFSKFRDSIYSDVGRALDMPHNRASGSSADYNFSSAMIDGLHDLLTCEIERDTIRKDCLDKALNLFFAFGLSNGVLTPSEQNYILSQRGLPDREWFFATEGNEIEPLKQTNAKVVAFEGGITAIEDIVSKTGGDVDEHFEKLADQYGKTVEEIKSALFDKHMGGSSEPQQGFGSNEKKPTGQNPPKG